MKRKLTQLKLKFELSLAILISIQVVEVWLEKVLKINFHRWVGFGGGWVAGSSRNQAFN